MLMFMLLLCVVIFVVLIMVSGFQPSRDHISPFEQKRRSEKGDEAAKAILRRETLLVDVLSLQRLLSALLLVVLVLLLVATFGWLIGVAAGIIVVLEYGVIARLSPLQQRSQLVYERYEEGVLAFIEKHRGSFKLIRNITPQPPVNPKLSSREELAHLVDTAGGLLTPDEKKLIRSGLAFKDKVVSQIMTPRGVIDSVDKKELLGPLMLDSLHKTGHSRFPVIDGDLDHIVGILYIQDLLVVDSGKRSSTVEKTMLPRVFYIREDQTLDHALAAFLRTHHHLFVVINEFRETVGLLSLEDTIEALMGRKIIDEFDTHEDLRVVAARNPRGNNRPEKREDV